MAVIAASTSVGVASLGVKPAAMSKRRKGSGDRHQ